MSLLLRAVSGAAIYLLLTLAALLVVKASSLPGRAQAVSANPALDFRYSTCPLDGQRHEKAHVRLLKSLNRESGTWNKKHPRWQILEALQGFDRYTDIVGAEIGRFEDLYKHVPKRHKKILEKIKYNDNFAEARSLLKTNAKFCNEVVKYALPFYNITRTELEAFIKETDDGKSKNGIRMTVSQTLKHMVRDWSPEGHAERDATFPNILEAISADLPPTPPSDSAEKYEVLIPGAGLGRLPHEIAHLSPSISVTSNEWSASMNIAYRYLASLPPNTAHPFAIHPFLENWSHARTRQDLIRAVEIVPNTFGTENLLIEGDFTTQFHIPGQFSAIATLFFIDTARNLISYFETIHTLLKPGGLWVNVGPLLYGSAPQVQLSLDEVFVIAEEMGFEIEEVGEKDVLYNFNASTLYKHGYVAQCWVARRRGGNREEDQKRRVVSKGVFDRLKERFT